jgi:putative PIN family toxin of toxin-antitoxin system
MRVVRDTNVLISALISRGGWPDALYRSWRSGRFVLISSEAQFDEFRRVSRYPRLRRFLRPAAAGAMLNEIRLVAVLASPLPTVDVSPDPADNFLLSMAQAGHADYLVTGDKDDLLALVRHKSTRIVSVHQMIDLLE